MKTYKLLPLFVLSLSTLCASGNVMDVAKKHGHVAFYKMIMASEKLKAAATAEIGGEKSLAPFTVFVPTNEAIMKYKDADKETLKEMVQLLVVPGQNFATRKALQEDTIPTVSGSLLSVEGDTIRPEEGGTQATIIDGPLPASNGVVYVIDAMLSEEEATTEPELPAEEEKTDKQEKQEEAADAAPATVTHKQPEKGTVQHVQPQTLVEQARLQKGLPLAHTASERATSAAPLAALNTSVKKLTDAVAGLTTQLKASRTSSRLDLQELEHEIEHEHDTIKLPALR